MLAWFLLIWALFSNSHAYEESDPIFSKMERLIGGNETQLGDFKYVVQVLFENGSSCTGGIISDNFVISAGHCFLYENGTFGIEPATIVAGTNDLNAVDVSTRVEIKVQDVYVPTDYYRTRNWTLPKSLPANDIAILKLEKSLNVSNNPNLERLRFPPKGTKETYVDMVAIIAGFGDSDVRICENEEGKRETEYFGDDKLHWAHAKVLNNSNCQGQHFTKIDDKQMCAQMQGNPDKRFGTCSGDSGSPLVFNSDIIIGVQIAVRGCRERRHPALYSRITSHIEFIERVLEGTADESIARMTTLPIFHPTEDYSNLELFD